MYIPAAVGGLIALVVLRLWQGLDYWTYSEGVYALTSRLWLDGADIYGTMAAAQPPGLFVVGAGALGIHDSAEFLRWVIGGLQFAGGLCATAATWRLSENRWAAIAACPLVLLTPWAVREHGTLTPELVVVPVLLGAALLAARPRTAVAAGVLAALAVSLKLPFLLPALGIVLCAADRRRALIAAATTGAVLLVATLVAFGDDVWRDVVTAQLHSGRRAPHDLGGYVEQGAWSLAGLAIPSLFVLRTKLKDPALARVWLGLTAGLALTLVSLIKQGTALNVLVPVEAALVPLALTAVAARPVLTAGIAFVLIQTIALVAAPTRTAVPFIYPGSDRGAWGRNLTETQVRAKARAARDCPAGVASPEVPFVAFVAERPPPGGQPDAFLVPESKTLERELALIQADAARCP